NLRVSAILSSHGFNELDGLRHRIPSPMASAGLIGWSANPQERSSGASRTAMNWQGAPASPSSYTVKQILRLDIPVDSFHLSNTPFSIVTF
ncbi:hypothetical protein Tco_0756850, partial [Tanacetum coccineum]